MPAEEQNLTLPQAVESLEKKIIQDALQKSAGSQRKAAKLIGITERILSYKMKLYGLKGTGKPGL